MFEKNLIGLAMIALSAAAIPSVARAGTLLPDMLSCWNQIGDLCAPAKSKAQVPHFGPDLIGSPIPFDPAGMGIMPLGRNEYLLIGKDRIWSIRPHGKAPFKLRMQLDRHHVGYFELTHSSDFSAASLRYRESGEGFEHAQLINLSPSPSLVPKQLAALGAEVSSCASIASLKEGLNLKIEAARKVLEGETLGINIAKLPVPPPLDVQNREEIFKQDLLKRLAALASEIKIANAQRRDDELKLKAEHTALLSKLSNAESFRAFLRALSNPPEKIPLFYKARLSASSCGYVNPELVNPGSLDFLRPPAILIRDGGLEDTTVPDDRAL